MGEHYGWTGRFLGLAFLAILFGWKVMDVWWQITLMFMALFLVETLADAIVRKTKNKDEL